MKKQICIVGSGTSGLQLAYALREDSSNGNSLSFFRKYTFWTSYYYVKHLKLQSGALF